MALDTRFVTIVDHIARSTATVIGASGISTVKSRPACSAAARNMLATSARSVGQVGGLPVRVQGAGLRPGEVQQRVHHRAQAFRGPHRRLQVLLLCYGRSADTASRFCSGASSTVSGVRSSWLTFWKNSIFARSRSASIDDRSRSTS